MVSVAEDRLDGFSVVICAATAPLFCLISITFIACLPGQAPAQDAVHNDWLGKLVAPISKDFRLHVEGEAPDPTDAYDVYKVQKVEGRRLCVADRTNGLPTWIPDSDVLPLDQAVERFSKQIEADPKDAFAFAMRGLARVELRLALSKKVAIPDPDPALQDYDRAIELDSQNSKLVMMRAAYWDGREDYAKAVEGYQEALKLDPANVTAARLLARMHGKLKDTDLGIKLLNRAIETQPSPILFAERAMVWEDKQDYEKAEADLAEALRIAPRNAIVLNWCANYWSRRGDLAKALNDADKRVELCPMYVGCLLDRASLFLDSKELDKALLDYEKSIDLNPKSPEAYVGRSQVFRERRDYEKSLEDLDRAIAIDPEYAHAFSARGLLFLDKDEIDLAIIAFNRAIAIDPTRDDFFNNRAAAWLSNKEYDKAIADTTAAIRLAPNNIEAYLNHALALQGKGEFEAAIAEFDKAAEMAPKNAAVFRERGRAWGNEGEIEKALVDFEKSVELNPMDGASLHSSRSSSSRARAVRQSARRSRPRDPTRHQASVVFPISRGSQACPRTYRRRPRRLYEGSGARLNRARALYPTFRNSL